MAKGKGTRPDMVGNIYAKGNKGGRPKSLKIEDLKTIGNEMVIWFLGKFEELRIGVKKNKKKVVVDMPFFSDFARETANVSEDTLFTYTGLSKEFFGSWAQCKEIQKKFIIFCGMNGISNSVFAIFAAKNLTDMKDKQEIEHSGSVKYSEEEIKEANEALQDL